MVLITSGGEESKSHQILKNPMMTSCTLHVFSFSDEGFSPGTCIYVINNMYILYDLCLLDTRIVM